MFSENCELSEIKPRVVISIVNWFKSKWWNSWRRFDWNSFLNVHLIKKISLHNKCCMLESTRQQQQQHGEIVHGDMARYADLFIQNNINGKCLLLLTQDDIRNIGVTSYGHMLDLHVSLKHAYMFLSYGMTIFLHTVQSKYQPLHISYSLPVATVFDALILSMTSYVYKIFRFIPPSILYVKHLCDL